jgi:hypothetical protein
MFTPNTDLFIVIPDESTPAGVLLRPATVLHGDRPSCTVSTCESGPSLNAGDTVFIYREIDREFMKQPAVVTAVLDNASAAPEGMPAEVPTRPEDHEGPILALNVTGEPVSTENRQAYRVSTVMTGLNAVFGDETDCSLLDVSATGFAVAANQTHAVGDMLATELSLGDQVFTGVACIQSVSTMRTGQKRYGTYDPTAKELPGSLAHGQRVISMEIQRQQLRRRNAG